MYFLHIYKARLSWGASSDVCGTWWETNSLIMVFSSILLTVETFTWTGQSSYRQSSFLTNSHPRGFPINRPDTVSDTLILWTMMRWPMSFTLALVHFVTFFLQLLSNSIHIQSVNIFVRDVTHLAHDNHNHYPTCIFCIFLKLGLVVAQGQMYGAHCKIQSH